MHRYTQNRRQLPHRQWCVLGTIPWMGGPGTWSVHVCVYIYVYIYVYSWIICANRTVACTPWSNPCETATAMIHWGFRGCHFGGDVMCLQVVDALMKAISEPLVMTPAAIGTWLINVVFKWSGPLSLWCGTLEGSLHPFLVRVLKLPGLSWNMRSSLAGPWNDQEDKKRSPPNYNAFPCSCFRVSAPTQRRETESWEKRTRIRKTDFPYPEIIFLFPTLPPYSFYCLFPTLPPWNWKHDFPYPFFSFHHVPWSQHLVLRRTPEQIAVTMIMMKAGPSVRKGLSYASS